MGIDINTGFKGKHNHGNESKFKSLRVLLLGDESNPTFCDVRDNLRDIGHDVITRESSDFQLSKLSTYMKEFDFVYHFPKATIPADIEPVDLDEEIDEPMEEVKDELLDEDVDDDGGGVKEALDEDEEPETI